MVEVKIILENLELEDPILIGKAKELGLNLEDIVKQRLSQLKRKYKERTLLSLAKSAIVREIKRASAKTVKGLLVAMSDSSGLRTPINFVLARKSGEHVLFSNFGAHINEKEIVVPSLCEVQLEETEFGLRPVGGEFKPLEPDKLPEKLAGVAIPSSKIDEHFDERDRFVPVVVKGTIAEVSPRTKFVEGEPSGFHPVLVKDEREENGQLHACMEIRLKKEGLANIRLVLEKPRYAKPFYFVQDLYSLCEDAVESFKDPQEQAKFVNDGLVGREVIACGVLQRYQRTRLESGEDVNFATIICGGLYELPETVSPKAEEEEVKEDVGETIDMTKEVEMIVEKYQWKPQSAKELDKLVFVSKGLPPVVKADVSESDEAYTYDGQFVDGTVAAVKLEKDSIFVWCSNCGTDDCEHILSLWVLARDKYTKMQPLPTKKRELFREEEKKVDETQFNKIFELVRSYCRALGISPEDLNEGVITEKLGVKDVPISAIRAVIQKLRGEANA